MSSYFAINNAVMALCANVMRPEEGGGKSGKASQRCFLMQVILSHLIECKALKGGTVYYLLLCFFFFAIVFYSIEDCLRTF